MTLLFLCQSKNCILVIFKKKKGMHYLIYNDFTISLFILAKYSNLHIYEILWLHFTCFIFHYSAQLFALSMSFAILDSFMVAEKRNIEFMLLLFNYFTKEKKNVRLITFPVGGNMYGATQYSCYFQCYIHPSV